jgi:hypothetical protein
MWDITYSSAYDEELCKSQATLQYYLFSILVALNRLIQNSPLASLASFLEIYLLYQTKQKQWMLFLGTYKRTESNVCYIMSLPALCESWEDS